MERKREWSTYLDTRKSQKPRFLILQEFEDLIGVVSIDIGFFHERERYTVVECAKISDPSIILRFLTTELIMTSGLLS